MAGKRVNATRERIKEVAQRLIAEHGVDGIAIRDIVTAAGQRNMASLHYYFRNKDELIKELIVDAADLMQRACADQYARLAEIGEPLSVRQLVHILVSASRRDPAEGGRKGNAMRFIGAVGKTHRHLVSEAIGDDFNASFAECFGLLRQRLHDLPPAIAEQRLQFFLTTFTSLLIARETALAAESGNESYWSLPETYSNLLDFLCGALQAPVTRSQPPQLQTDEAILAGVGPSNKNNSADSMQMGMAAQSAGT